MVSGLIEFLNGDIVVVGSYWFNFLFGDIILIIGSSVRFLFLAWFIL